MDDGGGQEWGVRMQQIHELQNQKTGINVMMLVCTGIVQHDSHCTIRT